MAEYCMATHNPNGTRRTSIALPQFLGLRTGKLLAQVYSVLSQREVVLEEYGKDNGDGKMSMAWPYRKGRDVVKGGNE